MFQNNRERLEAVLAFTEQAKRGWRLYDKVSSTEVPRAPAHHYHELAEKLAIVLRAEPKLEDATRFLAIMLPCLEMGCTARRDILRIPTK